eukprot:TRINITY_DN1033_c0_g1_i1.p1 TRINITY_DN1033_c0_g1~~TRINITY_DN1033_c0_g1_i1.p1  ORF type:complete len:504 (+),score=151.74 TRINITY_DN1033_c0_g1_i1:46-1512(+)
MLRSLVGSEMCIRDRCWWEAEITNIKGEFAAIRYVGWEKAYDDIVEVAHIRPWGALPTQPLHFEKHDIHVPANLKAWVEVESNIDGLKNSCGAWGLSVVKAGKNVKLTLLGENTAAGTAKMLLQLHAKHQDGLRNLENEASKLQIEKEKRQEQFGNSKTVTFDVDEQLIGFVVGAKGRHIQEAIRESGVHSAHVDQPNSRSEPGKVVIHGPDECSVQKCREMLEIVKESVDVEESMLGWIIGKRGATIREMESSTGILRVKVLGNTVEMVGTKEAVTMGKIWLDTHTTYLDPINDAREQVHESYQELQAEDDFGRGRYNGSKGKGGKGGKSGKASRSRGKGGNRSDRYFDDERDERSQKHSSEKPKRFEGEEGDFPDLPKPAPKPASSHPQEDVAIPKPSSGTGRGRSRPKQTSGEAVTVEAVPPRGRGRGRGGRGRGRGNNPQPGAEAKVKVTLAAEPSENVPKPNQTAKPQRSRSRKAKDLSLIHI